MGKAHKRRRREQRKRPRETSFTDKKEGEVDDGNSDRPSGNTDDFKKFADVLMGMEKHLNLRIANFESKFKTTIKNEIIDQLSVVKQKLNNLLTEK